MLKDDNLSFGQDSTYQELCLSTSNTFPVSVHTNKVCCSHTPIHGDDPVCEHILCALSLSREDLKREAKRLRKELRSKEKEKEEKVEESKEGTYVCALFTSCTLCWPKVYMYQFMYKVCSTPRFLYAHITITKNAEYSLIALTSHHCC